MLSRLNYVQVNLVLQGQSLLLEILKNTNLQINPVMAEVMQANGKTLRSEIHTFTCFECITTAAAMECTPILVPYIFINRTIKLSVVIIEKCHCHQLHK